MSDFKVQGQLGLDGSGFFSTLGKAEGAVRTMAGALAGAFSIGAITAFSKSVLDLAGNLRDVSDALGINVEFLQKFLSSARQSGGSLGDIEKFIIESNKSRQDALNNPGGTNASALARLGFSAAEISNLSPQQFLEKIISSFKDGASAAQINDLREVGGKSAAKLIGAFKSGIDEGATIITEETVAALDDFGDSMQRLADTSKAELAPALKWVADKVKEVLDAAAIGRAKGGAQAWKAGMTDEAMAATVARMGLPKAAAREMLAKLIAERDALDPEAEAKAEKARQQKRDEDERERRRLEQERKNAGLNLAAQQKKEKESKLKEFSVLSDSRTAIGGFLGAGRTASLANIAQQQLDVQRQTASIVGQMLQLMRQSPTLSLIVPS